MMRNRRTYIIAEAGVNHNGSLAMARKLIDAAAEAGADAVKFQTFRTEELVIDRAPKARYQKRSTGSAESQFQMLKKLELDGPTHRILVCHCRSRKIRFLSTPFDEESVRFLDKHIAIPLIKVPSGEITNAPYLLAVARTGKPIILSTGMSTLNEVRDALGVIAYGYAKKVSKPSNAAFRSAFRSSAGQRMLQSRVTLLHCTTEYPAPFVDANLRVMETLRAVFGLPVGLSDHTEGIAVSIAAAALGAAVIEKHFTLDRSLAGPDHSTSIEPPELHLLVKSIRSVEVALGNSIKRPTRSERNNLPVVRKSLVALKDIFSGERFTPDNLGSKRPGTGISPFRYWQMLGKRAGKDYHRNEMIKP